jgi:hypothetical protein
MPTTCGILTAGIAANCDTKLVGGASVRLLLANHSEILESFYAYNSEYPDVIESITLSSSPAVKFYAYEGFKASVAPQFTTVENAFTDLWNHQIDFIVFANSRQAKKQLKQLAKGRMVAIVENNYKGEGGNGDGTFELYGKAQGLFGAIVRVINDPDTQGAYRVTIQSPADQKEPDMPATIWDTDYATTKAIIDSLV